MCFGQHVNWKANCVMLMVGSLGSRVNRLVRRLRWRSCRLRGFDTLAAARCRVECRVVAGAKTTGCSWPRASAGCLSKTAGLDSLYVPVFSLTTARLRRRHLSNKGAFLFPRTVFVLTNPRDQDTSINMDTFFCNIGVQRLEGFLCTWIYWMWTTLSQYYI